MTASTPTTQYPLGSADAEHERLIRQAKWLAPYTERFFRDAGIGPGHRVLDLGSGVGDVALLAARLVGPSGEVVGIERDARSISRARARVAEACVLNVSFTQSDVLQIPNDKPFDAAVGRYILMFLPDPVKVLRSLVQAVRPGGVLAFQEASWESLLRHCARLPLWASGIAMAVETFKRAGTNTEMGRDLSRIFQEAGLPSPSTRIDTLLGAEQWMPGVLESLRPLMKQFGLSTAPLGDFATLSERLQAEVAESKAGTPLPDIIGVWARTPANPQFR